MKLDDKNNIIEVCLFESYLANTIRLKKTA